jgi:glycosyltransferase involved in cell wall biosynthesis
MKRKTRVVRDAIDPSLFRPMSQASARTRLGIGESSKLVLFPHNIEQATKRLWLAEAAVELVRASDPDVRLWVVNGRPADEMPWYYAAADMMIVTSVTEGGPSSVKEALACGLPVVSVPVGDVQLFDEAPDAMVQAGDTPEQLAAALHGVLRRPKADRRSQLPASLYLDAAAAALTRVYGEIAG